MGMPAEVTLDLTGLWHRETELVGAYTYGTESDGRKTFDLALETADAIEAERWLSATYPLVDHVDAIAHAAEAGRRGAVKIAFDLRGVTSDASSRIRPRRRPLDTADARLERRGPQPGEAAGRSQPRDLPRRAAPRHRRHRRRHPPGAAAPDRPGPAAVTAVPRHAPDHRLRRHQPAAAEDAPAGRAPAGDRGRARARRRSRRRRRAVDLRAGPAPADDRGRAAPRHRRPRLRRLRAARPALPARRRGSRQPRLPRHDRARRGGRDQQAGGDVGPARLRQHQPRRHGRRVEVDGHRPRQLPQPAPPPQPDDHGGQPQLHGPAAQRAAQEQLADGQGAGRLGREGVPDRVDAEHRHVPADVRVPLQAGVGVDARRTGRPTSGPPSRCRWRRCASPARSSTRSRRRTR